MTHELTAEIISIGTEILLGDLVDTNSAFIARVLRDLGINLYFMTTVGDNEERITKAIQAALARARVVITGGGLGPTVDDMTRQAVAKATNRRLVFHQSLLDQIAARFAGFNVTMTENNRQQAFLPEEAIPIENPVGTAPVFIVECSDGAVISLPGVPREMKYLLQEKVVPYLRQRYNLGIIKTRILKTAGIGESHLDTMIGRTLLESSNPTIGLAAHSGQVDVRITAKSATADQVEGMLTEIEQQIRERAGRFVFGIDDDRLEDVLVLLLKQSNATLAIVQAGITDTIAQTIRQTKHGNDVLTTSVAFASPEELRQKWSIHDATTLRDLAQHSAQKLRDDINATVIIAIVSDPDVDEGADITEGTAITVLVNDTARNRVYGFGAKSEVAREWVKTWSLSTAWRLLKEKLAIE